MELGTTAACTNILIEDTKGLGQRAFKVSTRYCFLFYIWFLSKKAVEESASIGVDLIGIVKTNTKVFFKATIWGLMKVWPSGSCIVLRSKPMLPG